MTETRIDIGDSTYVVTSTNYVAEVRARKGQHARARVPASAYIQGNVTKLTKVLQGEGDDQVMVENQETISRNVFEQIYADAFCAGNLAEASTEIEVRAISSHLEESPGWQAKMRHRDRRRR